MKRKIYQKPAVKALNLNTDVVMFIPGGGGSPLDPNPETPGVGSAKELDSDSWNDGDSFGTLEIQQRSVWDD